MGTVSFIPTLTKADFNTEGNELSLEQSKFLIKWKIHGLVDGVVFIKLVSFSRKVLQVSRKY